MLKIISSRKRSFLLPFLALFYFVFGANVIHPLIHKNHVTETVVTKAHGTCGGHYSCKELTSDFNGKAEHSSCPICDYLALASVLKSACLLYFFKACPSQLVDAWYMLSEHAAHPIVSTIRGPPHRFFS